MSKCARIYPAKIYPNVGKYASNRGSNLESVFILCVTFRICLNMAEAECS